MRLPWAGGGRVVSRGLGHDPEEVAALARREVDDGEEVALVGSLAQEHQLISGRHGLTYAGTGRQGQRRGRRLGGGLRGRRGPLPGALDQQEGQEGRAE